MIVSLKSMILFQKKKSMILFQKKKKLCQNRLKI